MNAKVFQSYPEKSISNTLYLKSTDDKLLLLMNEQAYHISNQTLALFSQSSIVVAELWTGTHTSSLTGDMHQTIWLFEEC